MVWEILAFIILVRCAFLHIPLLVAWCDEWRVTWLDNRIDESLHWLCNRLGLETAQIVSPWAQAVTVKLCQLELPGLLEVFRIFLYGCTSQAVPGPPQVTRVPLDTFSSEVSTILPPTQALRLIRLIDFSDMIQWLTTTTGAQLKFLQICQKVICLVAIIPSCCWVSLH